MGERQQKKHRVKLGHRKTQNALTVWTGEWVRKGTGPPGVESKLFYSKLKGSTRTKRG